MTGASRWTSTKDRVFLAVRTCTGCRRKDEKGRMLRVVKERDDVALDPRQVLPGRGAYVHLDPACLEAAARGGGLAHSLKCKVPSGLLTEAAAKAPSRGSKDP